MTKHNIKSLSLKRFSSVPNPAQVGAVNVLMKAADSPADNTIPKSQKWKRL